MNALEKMTLEDLKRLIDERIHEKLTRLFGTFETEGDEDEPLDEAAWIQLKADIERDRWTPPPGAKSSYQLLREDRDG